MMIRDDDGGGRGSGDGGNTGEGFGSYIFSWTHTCTHTHDPLPHSQAWSFCNEGECDAPGASSFRNVSYEYDGTRPVTQNRIDGRKGQPSIPFLDIQGFSHKPGKYFDEFHEKHPHQPMMATECCSCMSQRGVDQDVCPKPKDGGCEGGAAAGLGPGERASE